MFFFESCRPGACSDPARTVLLHLLSTQFTIVSGGGYIDCEGCLKPLRFLVICCAEVLREFTWKHFPSICRACSPEDMSVACKFFLVFWFALGARSLATNRSHARNAETSTFMVVSGITAAQEYCLSVENGQFSFLFMLHCMDPCGSAGKTLTEGAAVVLESCVAAIAAGDGRELFTLQPSGHIVNVAGDKCLGVRGDVVAEGDEVGLRACDGALKWEALGNGQLKVNTPEDLCLAQVGLAPGIVDVAANAAVMASSTANALSHGADFVLRQNPCFF